MTNWLTPEEQRSWRAWLNATQMLSDRLNRDLTTQHDLTLTDYEILVQLSEHPERRLRMSELADRTGFSRSRLSHQIDRMEKANLIERQACDEDRRGAYAVLTEHGWNTIVAAAPDHVASVRENLVDLLGSESLSNLGAACQQIVNKLTEEGMQPRA